MDDPRPERDPFRSLVIGSVIAAVVLAAITLIVLVGLYIAFAPRSSDRDTLGRRPSHRPPPASTVWDG